MKVSVMKALTILNMKGTLYRDDNYNHNITNYSWKAWEVLRKDLINFPGIVRMSEGSFCTLHYARLHRILNCYNRDNNILLNDMFKEIDDIHFNNTDKSLEAIRGRTLR